MNPASFFLCGVGGSGMSALARLLIRRGIPVGGSDRAYDRGESSEKFAALAAEGVRLYPQDGTGPGAYDALVVSSAVEESVPDMRAARAAGRPLLARADVLAGLFNAARGVAVGGTSGKTTTCGMAGWIFRACGHDPVIVNGGVMRNFADNAVAGAGGWFVAETDESDGSIALFRPEISVLTNATLDHKPLPVLRPLFRDFLRQSVRGAVVNGDDPESRALLAEGVPDPLTFSLRDPKADLFAQDIESSAGGSSFSVNGLPIILRVPGRHNISNALAALGAAVKAGVPLKQAAGALEGFTGIARRLDVLGCAHGVTVIDDFAHNPDKIAASLQALHEVPGRLWVVFQLHGFGPARLLREGLVQAFVEGLWAQDTLLMPEIFYAGGTATQGVSVREIVEDIARAGRNALFCADRAGLSAHLLAHVSPGDRIVVMGARDDTLTDFGRGLLRDLAARAGDLTLPVRGNTGL